MYDCARPRDILFQCVESQTFEERQRDGINGCGTIMAYPYFISFMLVVSLIFLNLFIAIILEGQLLATQQNEARVSEDTRFAFTSAWTKYDPNASGLIKVDDLPELIFDLAQIEYMQRKESMSKRAHFMFNLTAYPEVKVLMKVTRSVALSPVEEYIKTNQQVKSQIEWEFQLFLGSLAIPLYNNMQNYNYHDTLNAFVK